MNTRQLRERLAEADARERAIREGLQTFRLHLTSEKFRGVDPVDGERRDWIAVADVLRWIADIEREGDVQAASEQRVWAALSAFVLDSGRLGFGRDGQIDGGDAVDLVNRHLPALRADLQR